MSDEAYVAFYCDRCGRRDELRGSAMLKRGALPVGWCRDGLRKLCARCARFEQRARPHGLGEPTA